MEKQNPILVEITRGAAVESRHRGAAAAMEAGGRLLQAWGEVDRPVYARSAAKPLQALPLLETGAASRFGLSEMEIALACASHSGEVGQTSAVAQWLDRLGLSVRDLECGAHAPMDETASRGLVRAGEAPSALHNNCSGKHTGFLTTALHQGEPTAGYIRPDHPVQRRVTAALGEMGDFDPARAPWGVDGCGIPVIGLSLRSLALGAARMAMPESLSPGRAEASRRIVAAMIRHPEMVGGRGRFDTVAMTAGKGAFATKTGAEGVYLAIVPSRKIGIALKIDDGAGRAAEVAMANLLDRLGALDEEARRGLTAFLEAPLRNWAGFQTGVIRMAPGW
jgi:L-asparaginase II